MFIFNELLTQGVDQWTITSVMMARQEMIAWHKDDGAVVSFLDKMFKNSTVGRRIVFHPTEINFSLY